MLEELGAAGDGIKLRFYTPARPASLCSNRESPRLHRLPKNSVLKRFEGAQFQLRRQSSFVFVIPSGLQPARNLLFRFFQQTV
jgi:hypothetical protein